MLADLINPVIEPPPELNQVLLRLGMAFFLGICVALAHAFSTHLGRRPLDRPFLTTIVLLSVVIALVTIVIGNSAAKAFTLVGTLAIVRFRTVVEDTRDTAFVIFAVVSGMAAGNNMLVAPLLCIPLIVLVVWLLRPMRDLVAPAEGTLVLRVAAGKPPDPRVEVLLRQWTRTYRLATMSTARGGAAFDFVYRVQLATPEQLVSLVADLSRVEGVQGVELKDG